MITTNIHSDYFKWWCGTVIVGAIPIFIRVIAYCITNKDLELFNVTELVCFGFAIQISSIYFGIGQSSSDNDNDLIVNTTVSLIFVVIFSIIYIISLISSDALNLNATKILVTVTCFISLYVGQNAVRCAILNKKMQANRVTYE